MTTPLPCTRCRRGTDDPAGPWCPRCGRGRRPPCGCTADVLCDQHWSILTKAQQRQHLARRRREATIVATEPKEATP